MATKILLRGDTKEHWEAANPLPDLYEALVMKQGDKLRLKIGDGSRHYNDLPFMDDVIDDFSALYADQVEGYGRDLMQVMLGHPFSDMTTPELVEEAIAEVMAALRIRYNNNGEIDGSGIPDFRGLMAGDYMDGLDLSGIAAAPGGTAPQAWNATYKNNRLVLSGFNTYKGSGDTETTKNHILFTFRNAIATGYMNATNTNAGGYPATALRAWLEGADGDGSGPFAAGLKAALGGNNPILTIRKRLSNKGDWVWINAAVFLLSIYEVFVGFGWGEANLADGIAIHLPIYQKSSLYRAKRRNGVRNFWWLSSPTASFAASFCHCGEDNVNYHSGASAVGGVSPAFCAC
jgi:hypothetical protein